MRWHASSLARSAGRSRSASEAAGSGRARDRHVRFVAFPQAPGSTGLDPLPRAGAGGQRRTKSACPASTHGRIGSDEPTQDSTRTSPPLRHLARGARNQPPPRCPTVRPCPHPARTRMAAHTCIDGLPPAGAAVSDRPRASTLAADRPAGERPRAPPAWDPAGRPAPHCGSAGQRGPIRRSGTWATRRNRDLAPPGQCEGVS